MRNKDLRGERVVAAFLDNLMYSVLTAIGTLGISAVSIFRIGFDNITEDQVVGIVIAPAIVSTLVLAFLYYSLIPFLFNGQTLFKKVMKIKVVSHDYEKAGVVPHTVRNFNLWIAVASAAMLFYIPSDFNVPEQVIRFTAATYVIGIVTTFIQIIILVTVLASKEGIGLHDKLAKTRIVHQTFDLLSERLAEIESMKSWVEIVDAVQEEDPWGNKGENKEKKPVEEDEDPWARR